MPAIEVTGDRDADELISTDGFALLVGMLLDQQVPLSWAFRGPATLRQRLGGLDAAALAAMTEDDVVVACVTKPAVHRYPAVMGRRLYALAGAIVDHYDGEAERVWTDATDGPDLLDRLVALPGFGDEKAKITIAVLGKRLGAAPTGWQAACSPFDDDQPRSVADAADPESAAAVKEWKAAMRAAGRSKSDPVT